MANPLNVVCVKDAWTKVITASFNGTIINQKSIVSYNITTRDTSEDAPTLREEGRRAFVGCVSEALNDSSLRDVYMWANGAEGLVEVTV